MKPYMPRISAIVIVLLCILGAWPSTAQAAQAAQDTQAATDTKTKTTYAPTSLKKGDKGEAITKLQTALQNKGYFNEAPTGYYGTVTEAAVIAFQKDHKLEVDGVAGKKTLAVLYATETTSRGVQGMESEDIFWLSRIIFAEARGESYAGMVAVGNVVMNRLASALFPNTVRGVIFQYIQGIPQFSPVAEGTIHNTPSAESINAAWDAYLSRRNEVGRCLYFLNPRKAPNSWIIRNRAFFKTIGNHDFYE